MARARDAGSQVVLTSSPPASSHLVGLLLKSMTGLPWVAELRDPWVGNPFRGEPGVLHRRVDSWLEGQVIAAADAVSVVSPGMQHQLVARYGQSLRRRCHVVTNGFDPDDFEAPAVASGIGPYELLYTGSLASGLTPPDSILAAMTALAERHPDSASRLRLRIVGSTDLETTRTLRTFVARHHAPAVVVDAPVPHHEATRMMRRAHALLLLLAENTPWVLTSKVFEYLGSGTPILAVVPDGDCRELLDRCGGNVVCAPADVDGIVDQLRALAAGEPLSVGRGRRPDEIASFAWPAVAGRLAAILSAVSGP
jgi:glycosyltransferase involved in cell wall biosynthesis